MIAAKGYEVALALVGGRTLRGPAGAALLHDEDGAAWPRCSALIAPFRRTKESIKARAPGAVRRYFGPDYELRAGTIALPPRPLGRWTPVGACERIDYRRVGRHADEYEHTFGERWAATWASRHPKVYRLNGSGILRIELGAGCVWNWRGIVRP